MRCPYCRTTLPNDRKIEFAVLSKKRRAVLDFIVSAGTDGVPSKKLIEEFFDSTVTARTTIHNINRVIKPLKIMSKGQVWRLA